MNTTARPLPPLLLGLFRELQANGVPVGVRDYLDGLRALALCTGADADPALRDAFGRPARGSLRDLALALWARSDEERRLITRWFDVLPEPADALVQALDACLETLDTPEDTAAAAPGDLPVRPATPPPDLTAGAGATPPPSAAAPDAAPLPRARIAFGAAREGSGLPLPRLDAAPPIAEAYVLQPQPPVGLRDLAVLWRRYRRTTRNGPRSELDLAATLRERCRRGILCRPVCRPRRGNSARLLILADASPSMDPWRPLFAGLAASLPLGRLAQAGLHYFANLPQARLYATPSLDRSEDLDALLRRHAGAGLLIVSDAGSARGALNRRRARQTVDFLDAARRRFAQVVWLNPMPRHRWAGTTAALIAAGPVPMLPLDAPQLLRAIDLLRGTR